MGQKGPRHLVQFDEDREIVLDAVAKKKGLSIPSYIRTKILEIIETEQ